MCPSLVLRSVHDLSTGVITLHSGKIIPSIRACMLITVTVFFVNVVITGRIDSGVAEQLGGGWPSRGQTGAWLKRRAVLHVARRDVFVCNFVSVMTLLDEQAIRTENVIIM